MLQHVERTMTVRNNNFEYLLNSDKVGDKEAQGICMSANQQRKIQQLELEKKTAIRVKIRCLGKRSWNFWGRTLEKD